jgi:hypothetical protein
MKSVSLIGAPHRSGDSFTSKGTVVIAPYSLDELRALVRD